MEGLQIKRWVCVRVGGIEPVFSMAMKMIFIANCLQMVDVHLVLKYRHYSPASRAAHPVPGQFTPAVPETRAGVSFMALSLSQCPQGWKARLPTCWNHWGSPLGLLMPESLKCPLMVPNGSTAQINKLPHWCFGDKPIWPVVSGIKNNLSSEGTVPKGKEDDLIRVVWSPTSSTGPSQCAPNLLHVGF